MNVSKKMFSLAVIGLLVAGPVFAQATPPQTPPQTPPPQTPPAGQKPTPPPASTQPPAPQAQPPKPFPEGAKVGYVHVQMIASTSAAGKAASKQIQDWDQKKTTELQAKNKQAQDLQTKLAQSGGVLSDQARSQTEKELQRVQRELQNMQEDAQQERQDMTAKLQVEFQDKLNPIIEQIATEKNLHVVFDAVNSGMVWANTGLDITAEVIKRFDAASAKPPAPKK